MNQKIMMLEINWEMNRVYASFFEGKDASQRAENEMIKRQQDGSKDWVRSLFFGPAYVDRGDA